MSETTHLLHGDHPRAWCLCGVNFDFSTRYEQYQDHLYFVREQQIRAMIAQEIETAQFKVESIHHFHGTKCLCGFNSNGRARSATEHITQTLNAAQIAKGPQQ